MIIACNAAFISAGCAQLTDRPMVEINGNRFAVEIADTPDSRERGLMFRQEMPAGSGMLFIFDDEDFHNLS